MTDYNNLPYKTIAVLGLARSGTACFEAFADTDIIVKGWDDNEEIRSALKKKGFQIISLEDGLLDNADVLIKSPGIPHDLPEPHPIAKAAINRNIPITTDVALYKEARNPEKTKLFGVTGTNGKSTTTTLLTHVLNSFSKAQAGGNIGQAVLSLDKDIDNAVLELSSYQTELTDNLNADGVIWLNITPDHIDRHGDIEGYINAKLRIFERDHKGGQAVIACDEGHSRKVAGKIELSPNWTVTHVSTTEMMDKGISVLSGNLYENGVLIGSLMEAENLKGVHNHQNAACVYALVRACFNTEPQTILEHIISFGGLAHRQKKVAEIDGVTFVNDSKATNADATSKALASFDNIYWLAGGQQKEGGITSLTSYFPKIKKAYFYGEAANNFSQFSQENGLDYVQFETLDQALQNAYEDAKGNGKSVILLSPACASWDQYDSFEQRGDYFIDLVEKIEK